MFGYHFPGYNPYANQKPQEPVDIPTHVKRKAKEAGATHISQDGTTAYCNRYGSVFEAEWLGGTWGSWWVSDGLPKGAIEL